MRTDYRRFLAAVTAAAILGLVCPPSRAEIANTLHNLTPSGPGTVKNPEQVGMCRFCHTPHRAGQTTALWNRNLPSEMYDIYQSSTLEALPGQPTGASRLCLSCHDGTIALGSVLHTGSEPVAPLGPLTGRVLLDTDLSDDHPVSFVFDEALAAANGELVSPSTLTGTVKLDPTGQVQCTSCHDPHSDQFPKFLVMPIESAALCITCHDKRGWTDGSHATSSATWSGFGEDPWPESSLSTVAQNACLSCHDPHSAAHPERLLRRDPEEQVCLVCHNGNVAQTDVEMQLQKISAHPIDLTSGTHDPPENPLTMDRHVACADCHNPHAVNAASAQPPNVSGRQRHVRGVDLGGTPIEEATFAYEVCFKCHGVSPSPAPRVVRLDHETNIRLEIHPGNPSYHPVAAVGTNPQAITLIPPLSASSQIYCHDCHNTDEADFPAPSTPLGPHGSVNEPILRGAYPLVDFVQESPEVYALCYTCHDEEVLRQDASFEHKRHIENGDAPCVACHDPHGSRIYTHLINFLRFDEMGREVVSPSITTGRLEYIDLGNGRGRCFLNCHGEEHNPRGYVGPDKEN
jgi:predicted CXXCH cytochrome family protein